MSTGAVGYELVMRADADRGLTCSLPACQPACVWSRGRLSAYAWRCSASSRVAVSGGSVLGGVVACLRSVHATVNDCVPRTERLAHVLQGFAGQAGGSTCGDTRLSLVVAECIFPIVSSLLSCPQGDLMRGAVRVSIDGSAAACNLLRDVQEVRKEARASVPAVSGAPCN